MMESRPAKIRTLVFLEDAQGTLRKFSQGRFSRLFSDEKDEALPEHAGQWLRFAQITVGMRPRQAPVILQVHYVRHKIDDAGHFDRACVMDHMRLGASQFEVSFGQVLDPKSVLDAGPHLQRKRLAQVLLWEPTAAQDRAVREAALGAVALAWKRTLDPPRAARLRKRLRTRGRDRTP